MEQFLKSLDFPDAPADFNEWVSKVRETFNIKILASIPDKNWRIVFRIKGDKTIRTITRSEFQDLMIPIHSEYSIPICGEEKEPQTLKWNFFPNDVEKWNRCGFCAAPFTDGQEHIPICVECAKAATNGLYPNYCAECNRCMLGFKEFDEELDDPEKSCLVCVEEDYLEGKNSDYLEDWLPQLLCHKRFTEHPIKADIWYKVFPQHRISGDEGEFDKWLESGKSIGDFIRGQA
jgi:hypothetical protein